MYENNGVGDISDFEVNTWEVVRSVRQPFLDYW